MNPPKPGDRVSEYILLEQAGIGSFGEVWKARHHIWEDQVVAIKIATDAQYVRNLQREGVTIHGLRHPNVVRAIGLDPYAAPPYLIMEYIDGPSLREVIDEHPAGLSMRTAVTVLRGVLEALVLAHDNGVIHRDIKPANILLALKNPIESLTLDAVHVTDFGLGQAAGVTTQSILQSGSLTTEEGKSISGTMAYMAPEQRDGLDVDARADLYACGVVLFEMLTGQRPQGGDLPSHIKPELPKWMDQFFARCYTRRERRFTSAREMLDELGKHVPPEVLPKATPIPKALRARPACPTRGRLEDFCEKCGNQLEPGDNFCIKCGHQVNPNPKRCPACGAYPEPYAKFCTGCGAILLDSET